MIIINVIEATLEATSPEVEATGYSGPVTPGAQKLPGGGSSCKCYKYPLSCLILLHIKSFRPDGRITLHVGLQPSPGDPHGRQWLITTAVHTRLPPHRRTGL